MASIKPRNKEGDILIEKMAKIPFFKGILDSRRGCGESVQNFKFNKTRCRVLSDTKNIKQDCSGILYWMIRDCRIDDNWSVLFTQRLAMKHNVPMFIIFNCHDAEHLYPTKRQFRFLLDGLKIVEKETKKFNIRFYVLNCTPRKLADIVKYNNIGAVISDFNALKKPQEWQKSLLENLPSDVALVQVDAHNIVPAWIASDKQEFMARTLRPKINALLPEYMTGFPCVCAQKLSDDLHFPGIQPFRIIDDAFSSFKPQYEVQEITSVSAGPEAALEMLYTFIVNKLKYYGVNSNDPSKNTTSNLSYWIHFGHISSQRIAIEVESLKDIYKDQVDRYLEELIVRKELADNYCLYNANYDNINGAPKWAKETLNNHKKDKRQWIYTKTQLEKSLTHDEIWNAAQWQLRLEGTIHGYMRMYWCKKILEWTESPEKAIEYSVWLNDMFALDGSDPNGYVGIMWSICGLHDQGWKERNIFGKIRYMIDTSLKRKYDMDSYCAHYQCKMDNKEHIKKGVKRKK